ncbi:phosphoribosyltransferase family protein [Helicobacter sp. 23-1044]
MIDRVYEKFENRSDALNKLLDKTPSAEFEKSGTILVAISVGGLFNASEIARRFNVPFDYLFSESIFAPKNNECEVAIVSENMDIAINSALVQSFGISYDFIYGEAKRRYDEKILPDIYKYRKGENISALDKCNVILVDDGVESGLKMSVAIKTCKKKLCSTIRIFTPLIAESTLLQLENAVDNIFYVYAPKHFVDTEHYYKDFGSVDSAFEALNDKFKGR